MPPGINPKKVRLHDTDLRPFAFADRQLEEAYRKYAIESTLERTLPPTVYFWIPYETFAFITLMLLRLWHPYVWTFWEIILTISRIILLFFAIYLCQLSSRWTKKIGIILVYLTRFAYIMVAMNQAGVSQHDSITMVALIWLLYFAGISTPTFSEHVVAACIAACIKPARIAYLGDGCAAVYQAHECSASGLQTAMQQHAILLAIAVFLSAHHHSDRRRAWLFLPRRSGQPNTAALLQPSTANHHNAASDRSLSSAEDLGQRYMSETARKETYSPVIAAADAATAAAAAAVAPASSLASHANLDGPGTPRRRAPGFATAAAASFVPARLLAWEAGGGEAAFVVGWHAAASAGAGWLGPACAPVRGRPPRIVRKRRDSVSVRVARALSVEMY